MANYVALATSVNWWVLRIDGVIAEKVAELPSRGDALRMVDLFNRNGMEDVPLDLGGN
jgi:hypothetical protein